MNLSSDLISQFVKATKDNRKSSTESTVYGTTVEYNGKIYVKLDGSDLLTPVSKTTDVKSDERVTVLIKDHTATITGNITSPSARTDDVKEIGNKITEVEVLVADKVSTKELDAETARIDTLFSDNVTINQKLTASEAEIEKLTADSVIINEKLTAQEADIKTLSTEKLSADAADIKFATIESLEVIEGEFSTLESTYGAFQELTTQNLAAVNADIKNLEVEKLDAEQAEIKYANIDFANIDMTAVEKLFADSGIIRDLIVSEGHITGELVGVTISGDLIKANTVQADKLVVKGSDGIYYKLNLNALGVNASEIPEEEQQKLQNGLHGSNIIANTITAEKINVDDLVAFGATIGGFKITDKAIYSGVKESATNTTRGVYLDSDGQLSLGDSNNFLRYFKGTDGKYKLEISAASLVFSTNNKTVEETIQEAADVEVGARNLIRNSTTMIFEDYYFVNQEIVVTHDGAGNVTWVSPSATMSNDGYSNITMNCQDITVTNDGAGNVTISS